MAPITETTPLQSQPGGYASWMQKMWDTSPGTRLTVCAGGIILFLGMYGFLQERIMAMPYAGEYFSHSVYIVLQNRIISATFAFMMVLWNGESPKATPPLWKYAAISVSNVAATTCQYEALKYVSFPVQMLGKSSKMVPVMGWGIAVNGKSYRIMDWLIALAVTGGCTLFLLGGSIVSAKHRHAGHDDPGYLLAGMGLMLMLGYLVCDGFTSVFQEKLFSEYNVTIYNQMLWVNVFAAITSMIALLTFGGFTESMAFSARHPTFIVDALLLSCSATLGQVSIYMTIAYFGALVFAATMNTRQMISIMLSITYYAHPVTLMQIGGIVLCFGGLTYKTYLGHVAFQEKAKEKAKEQKGEA